jgi:hypothetical protein
LGNRLGLDLRRKEQKEQGNKHFHEENLGSEGEPQTTTPQSKLQLISIKDVGASG